MPCVQLQLTTAAALLRGRHNNNQLDSLNSSAKFLQNYGSHNIILRIMLFMYIRHRKHVSVGTASRARDVPQVCGLLFQLQRRRRRGM